MTEVYAKPPFAGPEAVLAYLARYTHRPSRLPAPPTIAALIPALQEVLTAIPRDEVARRCERAKVSWAPVGQPADLFSTPKHFYNI